MQSATAPAPLFEIGCKFCGAKTEEGKQLCATCLGITEEPSTLPAPDPLSVIQDPQTCATCGGPFTEYKIGPNWVRKPIQCHTCLMKKKYGADWKPGITKAERKLIHDRARRLAKGVVAQKQPSVPDQPKQEEKVVPADHPTIALRFEGPDVGMHRRLVEIAGKERRSMDQQVLFFLDRVLAGVFPEQTDGASRG